jgi:predicted phosphohydrolase
VGSKVRIAVTSDLHYDPYGYLTPLGKIRALAEHIRRNDPDVVIIAGDLAHGLANFRKCLSCFRELGIPLGVVAGNHDLWRDPQLGYSSLDLWEKHLPGAVEDAGAVWLEKENIFVRNVAIVGSMAWYDYSALDPGLVIATDDLARMKPRVNNDGCWIDWAFSDPQFAGMLLDGLRLRLQQAASFAGIPDMVVVTHVPILEGQMLRKPQDPTWAASNAYFGNLTAGSVVLLEPKVRVIVSGHTHIGREGIVQRSSASPVRSFVVPSEYGRPEYLLVEV